MFIAILMNYIGKFGRSGCRIYKVLMSGIQFDETCKREHGKLLRDKQNRAIQVERRLEKRRKSFLHLILRQLEMNIFVK